MGHDLWPESECIATLNSLATIFPNAKRFLLSDTCRPSSGSERDLIFTLGFEVIHNIMGIEVPTIEQWRALFEKSIWSLKETQVLDIAESYLFYLERD